MTWPLSSPCYGRPAPGEGHLDRTALYIPTPPSPRTHHVSSRTATRLPQPSRRSNSDDFIRKCGAFAVETRHGDSMRGRCLSGGRFVIIFHGVSGSLATGNTDTCPDAEPATRGLFKRHPGAIHISIHLYRVFWFYYSYIPSISTSLTRKTAEANQSNQD